MSGEVSHLEYASVLSTFQKCYGKATEGVPRSSAEYVAQAIYQTTADGAKQLRYVVGADAKHYIQARQTPSDQAYLRIMRGYFPCFQEA